MTKNELSVRVHSIRLWLILTLGSMFLGGALSLFLFLARTPMTSRWFSSPDLSKRILVVHVTLMFTCGFFGFLATIFQTLSHRPRFGYAGIICVVGTILLLFSPFLPSAKHILSNYFPVLDHPIFFAGLGFYLTGIALSLVDRGLFQKATVNLWTSSTYGFRLSALIYLVGWTLLAWNILSITPNIDRQSYFEMLFWGPGHIFQFAHLCLVMGIWIFLIEYISEKHILSHTMSKMIFGWVALPALVSPLFLISTTYMTKGFEFLMTWFTWPAPTLLMLMIFRQRPWTNQTNPFFTRTLYASLGLMLIGFVIGFLIRGSNTLVPAHYHATIGSIMTSMMLMGIILIEKTKKQISNPALSTWKNRMPLIFGIGQAIFVVGFALAGFLGQARKTYGSEQSIRSPLEYMGLTMVGIGGILAMIGGVIFFVLVFRKGLFSPPFHEQLNHDVDQFKF